MLTVIIVIHLMLVLGLIGVVLLQKSEGGGLGQLDQRLHDRPRHCQRSDADHGAPRRRFLHHQSGAVVAGRTGPSSGLDHQYRRWFSDAGGASGLAGAAQPERWRRAGPIEIQRGPRGSAGRPQRAASAAITVGSKPMAQRASPALVATAAGPASVRHEDFARADWECESFSASSTGPRGSYSGISLVELGDRR